MDEALPERELISAIIAQAIADATRPPTRGKTNQTIGTDSESIDAAHFLTTHRVNPFLSILGLEHDEFKQGVRNWANSEKSTPDSRALRHHIHKAEQLFPNDYGKTEEEFNIRAALQRIAIRDRRSEPSLGSPYRSEGGRRTTKRNTQ